MGPGASFRISARAKRFLKPFLQDLSGSAQRLVGELFQGMLASGRCLLSEIGRQIEDHTTLPHREKRFSRGLNHPGWWEEALCRRLLQHGAAQVGREDLVAVDLSDLAKPYARRMEYLDRIRDASRNTFTLGYWLYEAWHVDGHGQPRPLQLRPYSTQHPEFVSENQEWLSGLWDLMDALEGRGILLLDRGADRWRLLEELLKRPQAWIVRQTGRRDLIGPGGVKQRAQAWARAVASPARPQAIEVRLPQDGRRLYLVVGPARAGQSEPLILLCRLPWKREIARRAVQAYRRRWRAEDGIRALKQGLGIEGFLVRSMRRIERLMLVALLVLRFGAECLARAGGWTRRLLAADQRFARPLRVYLGAVVAALRRRCQRLPRVVWNPG
jgi:hypothetical protein